VVEQKGENRVIIRQPMGALKRGKPFLSNLLSLKGELEKES